MSLGLSDLSSKTRDRTCIPLFARRILNHWTPGKSHKHDSCRACCLEVGLWTKCSEGSLRTLVSLAKRALDFSLSLAEWPQMDSSPFGALLFQSGKFACRVDGLWGWTFWDFFSLGPSPDPPPGEPAWHTAFDPCEPGSWGDMDQERKILWTAWQ